MSISKVVAITGCDSGLGWAIAARAAKEGLVTVAGMYNGTDTKAAMSLKALMAHPRTLDVTEPKSVEDFYNYVTGLLEDNPSYKLYAIVNNAGVMTIGDYEWQTPQLIENTINVNLLGTMRVISKFLPDLRKSALEGTVKPRIVNVASHCGLQPLPGFGPYSASKAAIISLTDSLRLENRAYGLSVLAFIPGGFIGASNLVNDQISNFDVMMKHLNEEQKSFHGRRIKAVSDHLKPITQQSFSFDSLKDLKIIETCMKTLKDDSPKKIYKVEGFRYKIYYTLMKLPFPEFIHSWIVRRFINFP